jgi:pimeloyl-ACP methyl ester carboxylesterase
VAAWLGFLEIDRSVSAAERVREAGWLIPRTPPVRIAQLTIYGLFGFMFVNLVRSRVSPKALRRVGSVWDILTFWPRRFHPFAVRPYPVHAIPQLQALLVAQGTDSWRDPPLTVLAHSQGGMLVIAALAPIGAGGQCSRVDHLVTVGCPLRSLYMKAFPSYCHEHLIADVSSSLVSPRRWTNMFRFTDHVGRSVFSEETSWQATGQSEGPGRSRIWRSEHRPDAETLLVDCAIVDPRAKQARVDGHNDYWADSRVREIIG